MKKAIYADKFFLPGSVSGPGYLMIEDGKYGLFSTEKPEGVEIVDRPGQWVAPGLVDTHIHGLKNHDVMDNDVEGLKAISEGLLSCGVTSFLPTTLTASKELTSDVVENIGKNKDDMPGAKIRGIYLEGPFFTEKHKGAQNPKYFLDPTADVLEEWQERSGGLIRKVALAPERKNAEVFIQYATSHEVAVALGHSDATYAQAKSAVDAGASVFVHTYNGMSPLNHREPGMVGAALSLDDVWCELICDGNHVHPAAARVVMKSAGKDHVVLITDCMMAGAMPDGNYMLGEFPVIKKEGAVRLENGSLAGSCLELKQSIKNVVDWNNCTPEEAIRMATANPADSVHIEDCCGRILPGHDADFIVLTKDMLLKETYLDGECRYQA